MSQAEIATLDMTETQAAAYKLTIAAAMERNSDVRHEIEARLFALTSESEEANIEALEGYYAARDYLENEVVSR